jgi:hypothetical protein
MCAATQSAESSAKHLRPTRIRWLAVVLCILYGAAKITGSQFTILNSELSRPLGQVSGFWLTWYYFGYSTFYKSLIALAEIAGGLLLAVPRTALLGALLLLPVMINIVVIDICFGIGLGATATALVICLCLVPVISPHTGQLRAAVLLPGPRMSRLTAGSLGATVMLALAFTYWVANYNNRRPTRIDGVWSVAQRTNDGLGTAPTWRQAFFERDRAYWVTFRPVNGKDEQHHFEVDANGNIQVWDTWLKKGTLLMQGHVLSDARMELTSVGPGPNWTVLLERQPSASSSPVR